jgi:hypothetical protein
MTTPWLMPIRELVRFFIWWGFEVPKRLFLAGWNIFLATDDTLRLASNTKLWLSFEPMFGDYDWKGHLVGFFLRGVRVIGSLITYVVVILLAIALPLAWYVVTVTAVILLFSNPWTI